MWFDFLLWLHWVRRTTNEQLDVAGMKLARIPLRSEIALSRAWIALLLFETSLKNKILCKFNLKSFLEAYFHEIVIRSLLTLYGVTWRLSGLTLNPELACSISCLSSCAGGNECITNGLFAFLKNTPSSVSALLSIIPLRAGRPSPQRLFL